MLVINTTAYPIKLNGQLNTTSYITSSPSHHRSSCSPASRTSSTTRLSPLVTRQPVKIDTQRKNAEIPSQRITGKYCRVRKWPQLLPPEKKMSGVIPPGGYPCGRREQGQAGEGTLGRALAFTAIPHEPLLHSVFPCHDLLYQ